MRVTILKPCQLALTVLVLCFCLKSAWAALPPTLNYQGFLTDDNGVPIDGNVSMTFSLYDAEAGGSASWTDTRTVAVNQGVFSVELGVAPSTFPLNLFETPLWMGLAVAGDTEMLPRRPLTSTAFAFKAQDANRLEGSSAAALDQSAHVTDTANPHNVTAVQVGAADAGTLAAHIGDTSNPHAVTAAQTGAASSADFTTHAANSAAHHLRYTNGEAVAAMGVKNNANPLHHDKYTDANVVTAMLANDGAGSTLDSDKVDGLEASEIIDAAQDEVRTPISSLPYTISQPGSYYLTGNLDGSSGGIDITADDVNLDMMGFTIDGGLFVIVNDYGIYSNSSNITIKNGTITNFGRSGIYLVDINEVDNGYSVIDVVSQNNGRNGTTFGYSGIYLQGFNNLVLRCSAGSNGAYGIHVSGISRVIDSTAFNNGNHGIDAGNDAIVTGNNSYLNGGDGIHADLFGFGGSANISNNTVNRNSGYGIRVQDQFNNPADDRMARVSGNTVTKNGVGGIYIGLPGSVTENAVGYNQGDGIFISSNGVVSGNTLKSNTGSGISTAIGGMITGNSVRDSGANGIFAGTGSFVSGNTAYNNANWGIFANPACLVEKNSIYGNNTSSTANQGGLRVSNDSRVTGNTLDGNSENNIYVSSGDTILIGNHVTDSTNGIFFNVSGNYYRDNTGAGNATFINLNVTTQTDGGGNVAF